jgi:hypothetical protein
MYQGEGKKKYSEIIASWSSNSERRKHRPNFLEE